VDNKNTQNHFIISWTILYSERGDCQGFLSSEWMVQYVVFDFIYSFYTNSETFDLFVCRKKGIIQLFIYPIHLSQPAQSSLTDRAFLHRAPHPIVRPP